MKRKKYIALTLILSLLCIDKTYASCTQEELDEFKKIESQYKVTYEVNQATKDYTITFHTPAKEKFDFVIYTELDLNCSKIDETKGECYNIPIDEYQLEIIGVTTTCNDTLKELTLKLPEYNTYADDPLCEGIEEFYLCQPTYEKEVDRETFESRVNTYRKTKAREEQTEENSKEENAILEYIKDNLIQIIIIVVFIVLVIITTIITAKQIRKSRRLE